MACREYEPLMALNVEDDLSPADKRRVDSHLRECPDCWDLAEDLKDSQAIFKSIRQNTPSQTMFLNVRAGVLAQAGSVRLSWFERIFWGGFQRKATVAAVAVVVIAVSSLWLSRERTVSQPVTDIPAAPAILTPAPEPVPVVEVSKPKVRRQKPAPRVEASAKPVKQVAIKLLTDDPNVIIYWLVDEKGD